MSRLIKQLTHLGEYLKSRGYKEEALLLRKLGVFESKELFDLMEKYPTEPIKRIYTRWLNLKQRSPEEQLDALSFVREHEQEVEKHVKDIKKQEQEEQIWLEQLQKQELEEEEKEKKAGRVLTDILAFPRGTRPQRGPDKQLRGKTQEYLGLGGHLKKLFDKINDLGNYTTINELAGWIPGYVAVEFKDKDGNDSVLFINELPMKINTTTGTVGSGNAVYVTPQNIDGVSWKTYFRAKPRGYVRALIKEKEALGEPGWGSYNRNNKEVAVLLNEITEQFRGQ